MNFNIKLAFAQGYYDGRTKGWEDTLQEITDDVLREAYGQGYDAGITDYCLIDEVESEY